MRKRAWIAITSVIALVVVIAAGRSVHEAHWPSHVDPSPDWEHTISELDAEREQFFVRSGGVLLEADLLVPNGGSERKSAVIFSPGSGDSLYQNYAKGLIETYVLEVFLKRDIAVLLLNKRGMGKSEGNWVASDFQGRADDLYAGVQHLQHHQAIDPDRVGLIGHSQGGWIVNLTASQHEDVAFFISLAGPVTTVEEQIEDNFENDLRCQGYQGDELTRRVESRMKKFRMGVRIGQMTSFGMYGFDARIVGYDPREALRTVRCPGLFVFGGHDGMVPADVNADRFQAVFDGHPPRHLTLSTIPKANHHFRVTDGLCNAELDAEDYPLSRELVTVINDWLVEIGY